MEAVIYRKYRPKYFDEVLGQEHIIATLKNAVKLDRVAHAYLFAGPHGTGKTTVARILARAASCAAAAKEKPCGKCEPCRDFLADQAFDLVELDAASSRGIDEIRALRDAVNLTPLKSEYKIYIIDEVHMLTKEAFNALLKTLEEPPRHAIFILATTELQKVPDTIISRCQKFAFRKIPDEIMLDSLVKIAKKEGLGLDSEAAGLLVMFADGSFRDAQSMLGQVISASNADITGNEIRKFFGAPPADLVHDMINAVIRREPASVVKAIEDALGQGIEPKIFLKFILKDFRSMLLLKISPDYEKTLARLAKKDDLDFLKSEYAKADEKELENIITLLIDALNNNLTYLPHLPLELAAIKAATRA